MFAQQPLPLSLRVTIARLARHAEAVLDLDQPLSREYFYASLPLCVLDAVFSIGVRYEGVRNVVGRYCATAGVPSYRADRTRLPAPAERESITRFCARLAVWGNGEAIAARLDSRQRTSTHPTASLLKAEGVCRFADVLRRHGIDYLQDMAALSPEREAVVEQAIRAIPGQTSGISWSYFRMLSGTDDLVKPDRMILRFLTSALGRPVSVSEATQADQGSHRRAAAAPPATDRSPR